jgi:hypothetical protein
VKTAHVAGHINDVRASELNPAHAMAAEKAMHGAKLPSGEVYIVCRGKLEDVMAVFGLVGKVILHWVRVGWRADTVGLKPRHLNDDSGSQGVGDQHDCRLSIMGFSTGGKKFTPMGEYVLI